MNEFQQAEQDGIKKLIKQAIEESKPSSQSIDREDVDSETGVRYELAMLAHSADTATIINKINELINQFNKTLIDNRV